MSSCALPFRTRRTYIHMYIHADGAYDGVESNCRHLLVELQLVQVVQVVVSLIVCTSAPFM